MTQKSSASAVIVPINPTSTCNSTAKQSTSKVISPQPPSSASADKSPHAISDDEYDDSASESDYYFFNSQREVKKYQEKYPKKLQLVRLKVSEQEENLKLQLVQLELSEQEENLKLQRHELSSARLGGGETGEKRSFCDFIDGLNEDGGISSIKKLNDSLSSLVENGEHYCEKLEDTKKYKTK